MTPTQHPSNNAVLGAPPGWNQQELPCDALPVTRTEWGGLSAVVSYWQPTPDEIEAIQAGRPVQLWVCGATMPPVALTVDGK